MPPRARARQAGLALVSDLSEESFGSFLIKLSKKPKAGVEGIAELTRQRLLDICAALERQVEQALPLAIGGAALGLEEATPPSEDAILKLHGAAVLAMELLVRSQQSPPEQLLNAAVLLHDGVLITCLDPGMEKLQTEMQDAVARLCCGWWERRLPGNDALVARTIPYVLLRAVQGLEHNRVSLVHACYLLREALELLDFEDDTIADTKRLLLLAAMHPSFLREAEGRRFIAGLFRLEPQMTRELCAIVRNQIPSGQRFALEAYGEVLFRAWRDTVGPCAAEVESELQSLMQAAILASTPALAAALRAVLDGLHSQKNLEKRLNPTLVRLYDPILPRAFAAANAEVRRNAANLLVAVFPVMDPEAPAADNNTRLTQQLALLMDTLADPCPIVREAGVEGCCRCLKYFWEIIPAATSAKVISDITSKLAFDGSSRAVRVAVLRNLRKLVDSQHAQPVLKKALPSLSGLLHDPDPGVREALADLLVAVSSTRSLHFWGVVPPEELLEVIASDTAPAVARKVARMLVPSFFPNAQEGSARLGALLRSKPEAGLSFCRNLVARFYPSDPRVGKPRGAASSAEFTASVPLEEILQFAADLAAHLLATASRVGSPAAPAQPQQKRQQQRQQQQQQQPPMDTKAAAGRGKAGKKRAKKKAPEAPLDADQDDKAGEQQAAADVGADNGVAAEGPPPPPAADDEEEEDVVLQGAAMETEEGWLAILEGLLAIVQGLSAAVVHAEECGAAEVEAALPAETLAQLLRAAEEQLRLPRAIKTVLQIVAAVHFTTGAQVVRGVLFQRLAEGALPGCQQGARGDEAMELDGHRGPQGHDVGILAEVLKALATGSNAPKLVALLLASLGVRQPLPLRKPVSTKSKKAAKAADGRGERGGGGGEGRDALDRLLAGGGGRGGLGLDGHGRSGEECGDDIKCLGCKLSEPEDTMLLCDGCDAPCHAHCLRPALQEIPQDAWFCWRCEAQLQAVQLPPAAAARCVAALLQTDEGRELLCGHDDFGTIIQAMHHLAEAEAEQLAHLAQAGAGDEADSAQVSSSSSAAAGDAVMSYEEQVALLGDPWGALSRYCRAALHRAMWFLQPQQQPQQHQQQVDGSETPVAGLPAARRTPTSAGRKRRSRKPASGSETGEESGGAGPTQGPGAGAAGDGDGGGGGEQSLMAFFEIVPTLEFAVHLCGQLAELALSGGLAAQQAVLQYSLGALRVLHVVHQTDILDVNGQYVATVSCMCSAQTDLTQAVLASLADSRPLQHHQHHQHHHQQQQQRACVASHLTILLGLAQQMLEAIRRMPAGGGGTGDGWATPEPAGAGTRRPRSGGDADGEAAAASPGPGPLVRAAEEPGKPELPPPGVALEQLLVALVTLLCQPTDEPLLKGQVRAAVAVLFGELLASSRQAGNGDWLATLCRLAGEALATDPRVAEELQEALQEALQVPEPEAGAAEDADADVDGAAARAVRRRVKGGQKEKAAAAAASRAHHQAAAAKLSDLLQRESPAVGTLATVLVRVCVARKVLGHAMLLLARLAGRALRVRTAARRQEDAPGGVAALGATALLTLCLAACPDVEAAATAAGGRAADAQRQPDGRARGSRRCGGLAQEAAARAARAESEAAAEAVDVLRRAVEQPPPPLPQQQQQPGPTVAEEGGAGDRVEGQLPCGLPQARLLARLLVRGRGAAET